MKKQRDMWCDTKVIGKLERTIQGTNAAPSSVVEVKVMGLSNNSHLIEQSERKMMLLFGNLQHQLTVAPCLSVSFFFVYERTYATPTRGENKYVCIASPQKIEYMWGEMPCLPLEHCHLNISGIWFSLQVHMTFRNSYCILVSV